MSKKNKWDGMELGFPEKAKSKEEVVKEAMEIGEPISRDIILPERPDKLNMLDTLFNFQQGRILRKTYLEKLKIYSEGQISDFHKKADNAIRANAANLDKALIEIQKAANVSVQEIINASEENIGKLTTQSLINCAKRFSDDLSEIKDSDMHPDVKKFTIEKAQEVFEKAFHNIMYARIKEFEKTHNMEDEQKTK